MPSTFLYLIRHGATEANLAQPPRLQGRRHDPLLTSLGIRQAEATRDCLAGHTFHCCYCSPLRRAVQTAAILTASHQLTPQRIEALIECDVGRWEGSTWDDIHHSDSEAYARFLAHPELFPYPGGECLQDVHQRVAPALEDLLRRHVGQHILVVTHQVVLRAYLAPLLGLTLGQARQVIIPNAGGYLVFRQDAFTVVRAFATAGPLTPVASEPMVSQGTEDWA